MKLYNFNWYSVMRHLKKIIYMLYLVTFSRLFYRYILRRDLILLRTRKGLTNEEILIYYPEAIGDVFNLSLFIKEFKQKNNIKNVYLCTMSYIIGIDEIVNKIGVDGIFSFDAKLYIPLKLCGLVYDFSNRIIVISNINFFRSSNFKTTFLEYFPILLLLKIKFKDLEFIVKDVFLSLNTNYVNDRINKAVLFPYPGTLGKIDDKYWITISQILKENKIQTYTNIISSNQNTITGTKTLKLDLCEILKFVDKNTLVIARRNGLNDVFIFNNCKQFLLYDDSRINETAYIVFMKHMKY